MKYSRENFVGKLLFDDIETSDSYFISVGDLFCENVAFILSKYIYFGVFVLSELGISRVFSILYLLSSHATPERLKRQKSQQK